MARWQLQVKVMWNPTQWNLTFQGQEEHISETRNWAWKVFSTWLVPLGAIQATDSGFWGHSIMRISHGFSTKPQSTVSKTPRLLSLRWAPRLRSIESVMPSTHLILCRPILLLPPIPPSIRVFSNESTLHTGQSIGVSVSASVLPKKSQG